MVFHCCAALPGGSDTTGWPMATGAVDRQTAAATVRTVMLARRKASPDPPLVRRHDRQSARTQHPLRAYRIHSIEGRSRSSPRSATGRGKPPLLHPREPGRKNASNHAGRGFRLHPAERDLPESWAAPPRAAQRPWTRRAARIRMAWKSRPEAKPPLLVCLGNLESCGRLPRQTRRVVPTAPGTSTGLREGPLRRVA